MPMQEEDIDQLKALFPKARQRPVNFGLSLGKKPDGTVMILDLKKPPETLMRNAKKAGETPKVTCGTCEIAGKEMTLTCQADIPPGIAKTMKKFFTSIGAKFKVIVLDANGGTVETEGDEEDEQDQADAKGNDTDDQQDASNDNGNDAEDPLAGRWTQVEGALTPVFQKFAAADQTKGPAVAKAWQGAQAAAEKGDYKGALAVAAKLKQVVDAGSPDQKQAQSAPAEEPAQENPAAENPDAKKWGAVADGLAKLYMKAMANNPANRSQLEAAYAMAVEKADQGDFTAALTIAKRITPLLQAAATAESTGTEQEIPKDVVPFQKSRVLWQGTRQKMFAELKKLQDAIRSTVGNDPDLAEVVAEVGGLTDRLSDFDGRLEDVLDQITNAPPGPEREALKKEALAIVKSYQAALQQDFFSEVDTDNGFVNVAVASSATKSLDSIAKVLAA
ncbi:hypothetical protein [Pseudooceanicola sp.]|uniref:hypothetical protein n=1 Tax=Pseudooceanicola sp. TaxID=1914328 RepID=UPI0035C77181